MRNLAFILFLFIVGQQASTQNIYSALHLNDQNGYKTQRPKKSIETNIFYNPNGNQVDKNVKTYDEAGMIIKEERFDTDGGLTSRLSYTNDTLHRLTLTNTFERWTRFSYTNETSWYHYDSIHHLTGITTKDAEWRVIRRCEITCNEKGLPVKLLSFNSNGDFYGMEIAEYIAEKNLMVTSVISAMGETLTRDTSRVSFMYANLFPLEGETYNVNGDQAVWFTRNLDGTNTNYESEYTYDAYGNCTEERIYLITVKGNGKKKRNIDRVFKKQYTY